MRTMPFFIFLALLLAGLVLVVYPQVKPAEDRVVIANDVVLPKEPGTYMEVRHIVVKGTNREIGKALGEIAQQAYGTRLDQYASPAYGTARREYMKNKYPVLLERMKGVAESYGLAPDDDRFDTSSLPYGFAPAGCSMIFFPGNRTSNGHAMYSRNMDYFTATASEIFGTPPSGTGEKMCSKNYVLEMYPDAGYPSLVIGSFDLLNAPLDGMNSPGVTVSMLIDNDAVPITVTDSTTASGLSSLQLMQAVLDTAADTGEAKTIILNNTVSMLGVPLHMLVADRSGRSFIAEMSANGSGWHFTDNAGAPQILTNHAVYKYRDPGTFPNVSATDTYDSFNRYRRLDAYLTGHKGAFTPDDALSSMSLVYAHTDLAMEGGSAPLPMRTMWTSLFDLEDRSVQVTFYLRDDGASPAQNRSGLIFSRPFLFRLDDTKIKG